MTDGQLLAEYIDRNSSDAFARLVERYVNLVHAAARRQTRDPHVAEDVTQVVFLVLARKARTVRDAGALPAWLIKTTRYAAMNAQRLASRRRFHERQAMAMQRTTDETAASAPTAGEMCPDLAPLLDECL